MTSNFRKREHATTAALIIGLAAIYYAVGNVGLLQHVGAGPTRLLWPPTGVSLAALLIFGTRVLPGVALGSFLVNLVGLGRSPLVAVATALAMTLGMWCGYQLLRRAGFRLELDRMKDLAALVVCGALAATIISTTIAIGVQVLAGLEQPGNFWARLLLSWISSAMGVLVVTPFLLVLRRVHMPRDLRPLRVLEATAMLAGTVVVMLVATRTTTELLFLVFPFLIWAALRFQLAGAATAMLAVSTMAVIGAVNGSGPFEGQDVYSNLITIQAFDGSTALTALVLAVTTTERNLAHNDVEQAASQLASVVSQLDRSLRPRSVPLARNFTEHSGGEHRVVRERIEGSGAGPA
ncbi:MASE1 domain-containing protein [Actinopolymorpha rutila]|uniref:Integral membrane sensor domain MASE1 n=1 Tax=Actinopolymorpha rutila TaxID=446787 RepID=A0A852ZR24_9ACTN|nr:integral membrane sensor domain MASE1 [Actinopolymorpha rutila]